MIAGYVGADDGTNFVLIWENGNIPHLPLFIDIDEFKKIFNNQKEIFIPNISI